MKVCPTCSSEWPDDQKFCPNDGSALRSAAGTADLVGSVIGGNYHIKKKLGEGGMGAVYLGEHVKMSRKSAIKVMTRSMAHDPDALARFNREATNAARINHPNVCAIYDFGESDGLVFLAMEFIEGGSLSSIIEATGAMAPQRAASILLQTGEALQAAHDLGIVHRDLKPDNIMIAKGRGGADVVKVVDFGIAKAIGGEEGQKVTKTGLVVGTPEYMSPEQLSGDSLDGRSDIYSLALVFFRMITGSLPFQADSAQETMIKRLTDDPLKLAEAMPGVNFPPRLQQIMDRALARMPAERYASASEFAHDVVSAVKGMGGSAEPAEGATQVIGAHDAKTAALQATRVSSHSGGKTAISTPPTPQPRTAILEAPQKKTPVGLIAAVVAVLVVGGGAAAVMMNGGADGANGKEAAVIGDTAKSTLGTNTSTPNRPPARDTSQPGTQRTGGTRPTPDSIKQVAANPPPQQPERPRGIAVRAADADQWLDDHLKGLSRANAAGLRDTALAFFSATGATTSDKAFAAFVVGQAYAVLGQPTEALSWARQAVQLAPGSRAYQAYVSDLTRANP